MVIHFVDYHGENQTFTVRPVKSFMETMDFYWQTPLNNVERRILPITENPDILIEETKTKHREATENEIEKPLETFSTVKRLELDDC